MKKLIAAVLICGMAMLHTGCVNQHPDSVASSGENLPKIVATSPAVAQICARLDIELVGVCETSSELPKQYEHVTKVGMAMNPDLEVIKSLAPDYVLSPATLQNDLQPKYESIHVSVVFLNLKSVEGMYASIEELGKKFGKEQQAKAMFDEFQLFMQEYEKQTSGKERPKVLILMGLPGSYIVATESSYVGNLVKLAGGMNVYGDGDGQEFLNINTEDMKEKEPDIILRTAHAMPEDVKKMFADEFSTNDIWKHFKAVQNGRVYDLDSAIFNMSANFRYQEALEELQPLLYAEGTTERQGDSTEDDSNHMAEAAEVSNEETK